MNPKRTILPVILVVTGLMSVACQPITADNMASALAGQPVTIEAPLVAVTPAATTAAAPAADLGDGAVATVTATSLRVRAQPSTTAEVVAGIRQGEQYRVVGRSSDGLWLELAVPRAAGGRGWVSANFVNVSGPITDVAVVRPPVAATPAPTAAPAPTEAPAEEAAAATATAAPAEEAAEAAPTAVATEEPTAEPTAEPAAEVVEATPTAVPAEEASDVTAPEPGFALVIAEGARLRVRAEPNTESEIVGWLQPGETIAIEEISADGLWVRVPAVPDTENLTGGWVLAEFLVLGQ